MRCRWFLALLVVTGGFHPRLASSAAADDESAVEVKGGIEFKVGKEVVAKYVTDPKYAKPFLYPVRAPGGVPVTRGWPIEEGLPGDATKDHVHQKSVWFCHGDVIPEGIELKVKAANPRDKGVDFWSESKDKAGNPLYGTIRVVKVVKIAKNEQGGVDVSTRNEWLTPDGIKIMDELRVINFRNLPQGRLFTFDCTLEMTVCDITFGDTKEGSFGVRVHDSLRPNQADGGTVTARTRPSSKETVLAPPQKDNMSVWGQPNEWIDYSGKVDDKEVGIAVFEQQGTAFMASWHTRAYGLNAANPFGRAGSGFPSQKDMPELLKIAKKGSLSLRYGVYAHSGDAKTGKVAEAYATFNKLSR